MSALRCTVTPVAHFILAPWVAEPGMHDSCRAKACVCLVAAWALLFVATEVYLAGCCAREAPSSRDSAGVALNTMWQHEALEASVLHAAPFERPRALADAQASVRLLHDGPGGAG